MQVILCNGLENFILEFFRGKNGRIEKKQKNIINQSNQQLKNTRVKHVYCTNNKKDGFFLIISKPYDQVLRVLNSEND